MTPRRLQMTAIMIVLLPPKGKQNKYIDRHMTEVNIISSLRTRVKICFEACFQTMIDKLLQIYFRDVASSLSSGACPFNSQQAKRLGKRCLSPRQVG